MQICRLELTVSDANQSRSHYATGWPTLLSHQAPPLHSAHLAFRSISSTTTGSESSEGQCPAGLPAYWKFSVFTDDLNATRNRLIQLGWRVTDPVQFLDIGYLCHTADQDGLSIELLQRDFVPPCPRPVESPPTHWFRGTDTVGLITLRISAVEPSLAFYQNILGMKLLAVMDVDDGRPDPFSLYFLALTNDTPPNPEPRSVDNREWLYHRPYTIIELQYHWPVNGQPSPPLWHAPASVPGFASIEIQTDALEPVRDRAQQAGVELKSHDNILQLNSPDGHQFNLQPQ